MSPTAAQQPSIGRNVVFTYTTPVPLGGKGGTRGNCTQSPAIIQGVNTDGTCRLSVFGPHSTFGSGGYEVIDNVRLDLGKGEPMPGSWMWPLKV